MPITCRRTVINANTNAYASMCPHTHTCTFRCMAHAWCMRLCVSAFHCWKRSLMIHLCYCSLDQQNYWLNHALSPSGKRHRHHGDPVKKNISIMDEWMKFSVYNHRWQTLDLQTHSVLYLYGGHFVAATPPHQSLWVPSFLFIYACCFWFRAFIFLRVLNLYEPCRLF